MFEDMFLYIKESFSIIEDTDIDCDSSLTNVCDSVANPLNDKLPVIERIIEMNFIDMLWI